jgi:NADPH:quinone reductase-like Zn-dependent oxidoreductase
MLAVTAGAVNPSDPLSGLRVGQVPEPAIPPGWVPVTVRAASLNHHDVWTLRGVGISKERLPMVLGCDAAGTTADGREVVVHSMVVAPDAAAQFGGELLDPNASMLSEIHDGTFAETVVVPERNLIDKPPQLSFADAACLPTAYLTAYRALFTQAGLAAGGSLLIQGAGGGVSTAAILLAKAAGAQVWVTSRSRAKRDCALALGADAAFEPDARLPERVDVVLESVGDATWAHSLRALNKGGTVVVVGSTSGPNPGADLQRVFIRQLRIQGSMMGTREELVDLVAMLVDRDVRPVIHARFPLADARQAFDRMVAGDAFGKLVLEL